MPLFVLFGILFLVSFSLLFMFVLKRENTKDGLSSLVHICFASALLALVPTFVIGLFLFAIFGSTNLVTMIFAFEISTGKLIVISIAYLVYLFTIDSVIEGIAETFFRNDRIISKAVMVFVFRVIILTGVALMVGVHWEPSGALAVGVAGIVGVIEVLFIQSQQKEG
ncbi:hypothetical protein [Lentibacillus saliphilus]|uniref:hypothetical protein n=1 Tax=Lentibacillus saliphilus TaxID=2737028 RepID=UPI001C31166C|nr:hypothetical protein [Lentibacillus saliphilus]